MVGLKSRMALPDLRRLLERVLAVVRPGRTTVAASTSDPLDEAHHIAPRDGGWAELFTADGRTRMGRGQLMMWAAVPGEDEPADTGPAEVRTDAGVAVGGSAPSVRAALRSFTIDAGPPVPGDSLMVRPERERDSYAVVVTAFDPNDGTDVVHLDWPDRELPASITEIGGH